MSKTGWYRQKAAECEQLALASASAATRDALIHERDNWLEIAESIDAADAVVKQRK
jgi:hypothetical protein